VSVCLIIPTRNHHLVLDRALQSIAASKIQGVGPLSVVIIDNQSDDPDCQSYLASLPSHAKTWGLDNLTVMDFDEPFNFSKMNNEAVQVTKSDYLCFMNNDIEIITDDWLIQMIDAVNKDSVGCVGTLMFYPNETVQHAGVIMGMGEIANHAYVGLARERTKDHPYFQAPRQCSAVTGACLLMKRSVFKDVGGFDHTFAVAFNDIDLCLKAQSIGFKNVLLPHVQLYHHESLSRHQKEITEMHAKWGDKVIADANWNASKPTHQTSNSHYLFVQKRRWRLTQRTAYTHKDLVPK